MKQLELQKEVIKYRIISIVMLLIGAFAILFVIWNEELDDLFFIAYLAYFIALIPIILRSNRLHRKLRALNTKKPIKN